jgi:hypothetical protein
MTEYHFEVDIPTLLLEFTSTPSREIMEGIFVTIVLSGNHKA